MKVILLALSGLLLTQFFVAQLKIEGVVTNKKGEPLINATVAFDNGIVGAVTNENGIYQLVDVTKGVHEIHVSFLGYETYSELIEVKNSIKKNFKLSLSDIITEEVFVYATRAGENTPVAHTSVSKEEITERNMGQDIPYLLSLTPSFVTTSDAGTGIGYTNFRIRGTDANRINITINGIPLNDAESHGVWWVNMPDFASSIEDVQVQRGVGTSTNGAGAFGASVNVKSNSLKRDSYSEISSAAGSFNTFKNTLKLGTGLINEHFSFDARLSKITSDGFLDRSWSDLKSFFVSGGYYSENTTIRINVFSGKERTYQAWNGIGPELLQKNITYNSCGEYYDNNGNIKYYENQTDNYQQDHYQLHLSHNLLEKLTLNAAFHYTYGRGCYEEYEDDTDLNEYGLNDYNAQVVSVNKTDLIRQKWLDNDFYGLTTSLVYSSDKMELIGGGAWNNYAGRHFGNILWVENNVGIPGGYEWYRSNGDKTDFNAFVKMNYEIFSNLFLYADVQYRNIQYNLKGIDDKYYDYSDGNGFFERDITQSHIFNFLNPKVGIFYTINNSNRVYTSYSVANREPNRANYIDANPLQMPTYETLYDVEVGYTYKTNMFNFGINMYYMLYDDQLVNIGQLNDVGASIMTNVDDSYRRGVELMFAYMPVRHIKWDVNATFSENRIAKYTQFIDVYDVETWEWKLQQAEEYSNTDISFSPSLIANSVVSLKPLQYLNMQLITQFVGEQYADNTSNIESMIDSYFVNSIKLTGVINPNFADRIEISMLINNLLNAKYENNAWSYPYFVGNDKKYDIGLYPQAGINFMAGVSVKF
ncbi:MAG: TonB-dependent receptor [Marinilabiliaceae bacterium]|nr:TonB-dependent receptor [Marinilabiliaceae bacterium]